MSSILKYAGKYRRYIFTALVLISISVPIGVVPYFLISGLIGKYISEAAVMADVVKTSVLILICFTVKYILYGEGLNLSHEGAYASAIGRGRRRRNGKIQEKLCGRDRTH